MWAWIKSHKTRIVGYIGVIFGFLELNVEQVKALIPESYRGVVPLILGGATAIIGHMNASGSNDPPAA